jgi:hypothetical protein
MEGICTAMLDRRRLVLPRKYLRQRQHQTRCGKEQGYTPCCTCREGRSKGFESLQKKDILAVFLCTRRLKLLDFDYQGVADPASTRHIDWRYFTLSVVSTSHIHQSARRAQINLGE